MSNGFSIVPADTLLMQNALRQPYNPSIQEIKNICFANGYGDRIAKFFPHYALMKGRSFADIDVLKKKGFSLDYEINRMYSRMRLLEKIEQLGQYGAMFGFAGIVILVEGKELNDKLSLNDKIHGELFFNIADPLALRPKRIVAMPDDPDYQNPRDFWLNGRDVDKSKLVLLTDGTPYYLLFNNASMSFTGFSIITRIYTELVVLELAKRQLAILMPKIGTPHFGNVNITPDQQQAINNAKILKSKIEDIGYDNALLSNEGETLAIMNEFGTQAIIDIFNFLVNQLAAQTGIQSNFLRMDQTEGGLSSTGELVMKQHADSLELYQKNKLDNIFYQLDDIVFLRALVRFFDDRDEALQLYAKYRHDIRYTWQPINIPNDTEKAAIESTKTTTLQNMLATIMQAPNDKLKESMLIEYQKMGYLTDLDMNDLKNMGDTPTPAPVAPSSAMGDSFFLSATQQVAQKKKKRDIESLLSLLPTGV